jgi:hypothetical protein
VVELYSENAHFLAGDMRDDDVHATREEARVLAARAAHNSVFLTGSVAAKKLLAPVERMRIKAQRRQQRDKLERLAGQMQSDADIITRRLDHMQQASNKNYADKIAKKRLRRGMSIGAYRCGRCVGSNRYRASLSPSSREYHWWACIAGRWLCAASGCSEPGSRYVLMSRRA